MAMVEATTAATTAADTLGGAGAITVGGSEVGAIQVMVGVGAGVGDSGLDSAGAGHTRIHTATALGGDTRILTTTRIVLLATIALITETTILRNQIPGHKPGPTATRRLLRDHPRGQDLRTIRPVMVRTMSRAVSFFQLIG